MSKIEKMKTSFCGLNFYQQSVLVLLVTIAILLFLLLIKGAFVTSEVDAYVTGSVYEGFDQDPEFKSLRVNLK